MDSRARLDTGMCLDLAAGPNGLATPACCSSEGDWGLEPDPRKKVPNIRTHTCMYDSCLVPSTDVVGK